jgi:beta-1,4-mannosyl-glycoprotein beta-1,4-N-acetylglucosaminyltransferase|tara:strand:- start:859 stop:1668 length:810 start_codon:yes stop_codon:yes gene_type:complete
MKNKIYDCITFFNENFIFNFRYHVLKDYVDTFVICESKFDHQNRPKKLNFNPDKSINKDKIKYVVLNEPFPQNTNVWENQALQREFMLTNLSFIENEEYIFFSDPDEIPNPGSLVDFKLNKKYGIFLQECFNYKFNLHNPYESPWEGTRVCKKKNLKSIDFMRQKVKMKNLKYSFFRIDKERSIEVFDKGGWHFNNLMSPKKISLKLKTFAHTEFSKDSFSSVKVIEEKISKKIDLFERGHNYNHKKIDESFPEYLVKNQNLFNEFIIY